MYIIPIIEQKTDSKSTNNETYTTLVAPPDGKKKLKRNRKKNKRKYYPPPKNFPIGFREKIEIHVLPHVIYFHSDIRS